MPSKRLVHADVVSAPWALAEQAPRSAGSRRRARHSPRIDCGQGTESATRAPGSRPRRSNRPSGLRRSDQRLPRRLSEGRGLTKLRGRAAPSAGKARVSVVRRAGQPENTRIEGRCGGRTGSLPCPALCGMSGCFSGSMPRRQVLLAPRRVRGRRTLAGLGRSDAAARVKPHGPWRTFIGTAQSRLVFGPPRRGRTAQHRPRSRAAGADDSGSPRDRFVDARVGLPDEVAVASSDLHDQR